MLSKLASTDDVWTKAADGSNFLANAASLDSSGYKCTTNAPSLSPTPHHGFFSGTGD